jgi:CoA binding domain
MHFTYQGFQNFGFRIVVGAFDNDLKTIGKWVHGRKVQAINQLIPFVRRGGILLGVLTVPAGAAQETAELMVRASIKGIWNFTPVNLQLPVNTISQKEDLEEGSQSYRIVFTENNSNPPIETHKSSNAEFAPVEFSSYPIARAMLFHHGSCSSMSGVENSPLAVFTVSLSPPTLPI